MTRMKPIDPLDSKRFRETRTFDTRTRQIKLSTSITYLDRRATQGKHNTSFTTAGNEGKNRTEQTPHGTNETTERIKKGKNERTVTVNFALA